MGVSGPNNFNDDAAFNYLVLLQEQLKKDIRECFTRCENHELDLDDGNGILMPSMDILTLTCKHYGIIPEFTRKFIQAFKDAYLQLYDDTIDEYGPTSRYKHDRRRVVQETFENLEMICENR